MGATTGSLAVDRTVGWKGGREVMSAVVLQLFDLYAKTQQERYDIFHE